MANTQVSHRLPIIEGVEIRRDGAGRYCLNDLHRASGGEKRNGPSYWLANAQTRALIDEMAATGIPVVTFEGGRGGTYVADDLVYAYAMWISPAFNLKVIRAYRTSAMAQPAFSLPDFTDPAAAAIAWAEQFREKQALQIQNDSQAQQLAIDSPKAAALDIIADSDGSFCLTDASKHFATPARKFINMLAEMDWIYRRPGSENWCGKAYRINTGDLDHLVRIIKRVDGTDLSSTQCRITAKGMTTLAKIFAKKNAGLTVK